MQRRTLDIGVGLIGLAVLAYALLRLQQVLFGVVAVVGIVSSYWMWRSGDTDHAKVLAVFWAVLIAAFWTARAELQLLSILVAVVGYLVWNINRMRRENHS